MTSAPVFRQGDNMQRFLLGAFMAAFTTQLAWSASSITVYSDGFGLISEERELQLKKGRQEWLFDGVSRQIEPASVLFSCEGVTLREQNYEYDLVDEATLLQRYLGHEVEVQIKEGEWLRGTLLSGGMGLILQGAQGVTSLKADALVAVRYPSLPEGLRLKPALRWELDSRVEGKRSATVSYLSGGLGWKAEYVCLLAEDESRMEMASWVNLSNQTGLGWTDANLQLVAGKVNRVQTRQNDYMVKAPRMAMAADAMEAGFQEEAFFEYHLYTLPRPVSLADRQDKQVALFDAKPVALVKRYVSDSQRGQDVAVELEFTNSKEKGPGLALPEGTVRLYKKDSRGRRQLVGEDALRHTPMDEKVVLNAGKAFDLVSEHKVLDEQRSGRSVERDYEVVLRNRKEKETVEITVREHFWGDWSVVKSDVKAVKKDAGTLEMVVPLKAGESRTVRFRVRQDN